MHRYVAVRPCRGQVNVKMLAVYLRKIDCVSGLTNEVRNYYRIFN